MMEIKEGTWLQDIIAAYNQLGGEADYSDLYKVVKEIRLAKKVSWTEQSNAVIRREVENHSSQSEAFLGRRDIFYSVNGLGHGRWGLLPAYRVNTTLKNLSGIPVYSEGIEGILREVEYWRRTRDPRLVEERKKKDSFTCQVCGFCLKIGNNKYVIDVHHLNPIGNMNEVTVTNISDLVCLCPTCHRIAHSRKEAPISLPEIKQLLLKSTV